MASQGHDGGHPRSKLEVSVCHGLEQQPWEGEMPDLTSMPSAGAQCIGPVAGQGGNWQLVGWVPMCVLNHRAGSPDTNPVSISIPQGMRH